MFLSTGLAKRFEEGDFRLIVRMSGIEFVYTILDEAQIEIEYIPPVYTLKRSEEYWTGWALAYYQWYTSKSFREIVQYVPITDIQVLYSPLS